MGKRKAKLENRNAKFANRKALTAEGAENAKKDKAESRSRKGLFGEAG